MARADIEAGRAFVRLFLKNDLTAELRKSLDRAGQAMQAFGSRMTTIGSQIAAAGVASLAPFALSLKTFANFDDAMRAVGAVTGSTEQQFAALTEKAKQLGATTSFTATEVAQLMTELGRAGFVPDEIDKMTASVLALSRATGTDAAMSAGIMAATIRQFNLDASAAGKVADVLTTAANKSFNTVEQLGEALSYAGPVAADFGMSIEDTAAILGTLGNVGIQASNAGTVIRRMLILTGAEAEKLKGIFGVEFQDAAGNARPLLDVLQEVADATKDMGTGERAAAFNEAFGLLGITGASALSKNIAGARDLREAMDAAGGAAERTAKEMDAGLGGSFRLLMSAVDGLKIAVAEQLTPVLQPLMERAIEIIGRIQQWATENKELVVGFVAVASAAVVLGTGLVGLGLAITAIGTAVSGLAAVLGVVASPIGAIVLAVGAAVAAWMTFTESGQRAAQAVGQAFSGLLQNARLVVGGIVEAISTGDYDRAWKILVTAGQLAFVDIRDRAAYLFGTYLPQVVAAGINGIAETFQPLLDNWVQIASAMGEALIQGLAVQMPTFLDLLDSVWIAVQDVFGGKQVGDAIADQMKRIMSIAAEEAAKIGPIFSELGRDLKQPASEVSAAFGDEFAKTMERLPDYAASADSEELRKELEALVKRSTAPPRGEAASVSMSATDDRAGLSQYQQEIAAAGATDTSQASRHGIGDVLTFSAASAQAAGFQAKAPAEKVVDKLTETNTLLERLVASGEATAKEMHESRISTSERGTLVFGSS